MRIYNNEQLENMIELGIIIDQIEHENLSDKEKSIIAREIYNDWLTARIDFYLERKERECFVTFSKNKILIKNLINLKLKKVSVA